MTKPTGGRDKTEERGKNPAAAAAAAAAGVVEDGRKAIKLKKVREMVAAMGRAEKARLFDVVSAGGLQDEDLMPQIARVVVESLNGPRSEHARRLWTGWFDPVLQRDDAPLLAEARLPGCLHIVDASAWWLALSPLLDAKLVRQIQTSITRLAQDQPLEKIFASVQGRAWAEELRQKTLAILAGQKASPASANRLIAAVNLSRVRLLKGREMTSVTQLGMADLLELETMMSAAPCWQGLHGSAVGADRESLLGYAAGLPGTGCSRDGAAMLLLARLHASRDQDFALDVYRFFPLPLVCEAVVGQFLFAAHVTRQWLEHRFFSRPEAPPHRFIALQETAPLLRRLFGWYDTLHGLELDRTERVRASVDAALNTLIAMVEQELVPAVSQDVLALTPRSSPRPCLEGVDFVVAFKANCTVRGLAMPDKLWPPTLGPHLAGLFQGLASPRHGQARLDLLVHAEFAELADMLGTPIEITTLNSGLIALVDASLRDRTSFDPLEQLLIERVVARCQAERRRSKWWVASGLDSLLEIAAERGIGGG